MKVRRGRARWLAREHVLATFAPNAMSLLALGRKRMPDDPAREYDFHHEAVEAFVRPWPSPWAYLHIRAGRVSVMLTTSHGYVGDRQLRTVVPLYGTV